MSTLTPKVNWAIAALFLIAAILSICALFTHQSKKVDNLNREAGRAEVVQDIQAGTIAVQDKSTKLADKAVAQAAVKEQKAEQATQTRKVELEKKIHQIDVKYEQLPDLPEMDRVKEHEKSIARLESLREAYCMTGPNLKDCPAFEYVTIKKE